MRLVTPNGDDAPAAESASPIVSMLLGLITAEKAGKLSGLMIIGTLAESPGQVIWKVEGMDTLEAVARLEFVKTVLINIKIAGPPPPEPEDGP